MLDILLNLSSPENQHTEKLMPGVSMLNNKQVVFIISYLAQRNYPSIKTRSNVAKILILVEIFILKNK